MCEPEATQIGLQYQKPSGGRIMVWPSVRGYIIKDGLAVFIGNRAYEVLDPDDPRATSPRVFVVKAPEMSFDITDEIILHWAQASGKDSVKALKSAAIVALELHDDKVNCDFEFSDWPETIIRLDWTQISDIMREVKEKGTVRKDRVWGTSYIEKEFKHDVGDLSPV